MTNAKRTTTPNRRPTSHDVAQLAGVSQSAVTRCFRPGHSLSEKKRTAILEAASTLGYQPNAFASSLITQRSYMVAVLISNLTNLYYPQVLAELTRRLDERGYRVLLFALQSEADVVNVLPQLWRYRVDGAITAAHLAPEHLTQFTRNGVPVVLYNRSAEKDTVPSIFCDSVGGERLLVDRLVAAGHQQFVILSGPEDNYVSKQRVEAAISRLAHHGRNATVLSGHSSHESGAESLRQGLALDPRPDAAICANDLIAMGAMDAARNEFNLLVPEDISIVGFDGVEPAAWPSYQLTTIRQPVEQMTQAAVAMLLDHIADPNLSPEVRSFSGALMIGRSARLG